MPKSVREGYPLWKHLHRGEQGLSRWDACHPAHHITRARRCPERRRGVGRFLAGAHLLSARMQYGEPPVACEPHLLPHGRGSPTGWLSPLNITWVLEATAPTTHDETPALRAHIVGRFRLQFRQEGRWRVVEPVLRMWQGRWPRSGRAKRTPRSVPDE